MSFSLPKITVQDMLERGVHFGHKRSRWNPKMAPYIYKEHHGVHILDLPKTMTMMDRALKALYSCVRDGGRVLFVGTKLQARSAIQEAGTRCGQYYVNHRWLGGTLTNWKTVSESLKKLRDIEEKMASPDFGAYTKREQLDFQRKLDKYNQSLGGIRNMGGLPDMVFAIDINKEMVAIREARHLKIPIVAIVDTNTDPTLVDYAIPGNDDGLRAIQFYCDIVARTVISGLQEEFARLKPQAGPRVAAPRTAGRESSQAPEAAASASQSSKEPNDQNLVKPPLSAIDLVPAPSIQPAGSQA
jgi:small subunit ribosomal protein S2